MEVIQQKLRELEIMAHSANVSMDFMLEGLKRQFFYAALERNKGNVCKAARELGRHRNSFSYSEKKLGVGVAEIRRKTKRV